MSATKKIRGAAVRALWPNRRFRSSVHQQLQQIIRRPAPVALPPSSPMHHPRRKHAFEVLKAF
ncbi:hypothetical protein PGTUg99_019084 [Puccinia graminis f. sp. tritici]|uniref:Uncharacterized protein n=1 Tax=Puccinia graminis f. sp. tritici TaxID=56615 RepID=A0A5B0MRR2_PUCGR|nr:hypothetical protein PGTUg99_019084 [Puccinia graminis f. sp. tritici]